jgi:hypothetical protein
MEMALIAALGPVILLAGMLLVLVVLPIRILWGVARRARDRSEKIQRLAERMRENFSGVSIHRIVLRNPEIRFTAEGRKAALEPGDFRRLRLRMEEHPPVALAVMIRSRRWLAWPAGASLDPVPTGDPLIDGSVELFANTSLAGFLRDRFLDSAGEGAPSSDLVDSLHVLKGLPGVKRFVFRFIPDRGVSADLKLKTEDLYFRMDDLEALLHHLHQLHDHFANYDRPSLPPPDAPKPKSESSG